MELNRSIQPNEYRIKALLVLLRISFAIAVARLIFELFRYSMWTKILNGVPISDRQLMWVERIDRWSLLLLGLIFIGALIAMCMWMYRSYSNLGQFERLRFPEVMAVVGWFLPVFSWFGPFLIYSSLVKGYENILTKQDYIRKNSRRQALKNWWWTTWIAGNILLAFSFGYERFNFFCSAMSAAVLMLSNLLLISSLSDMKMMEQGIANLKNVTQSNPTSDDLLDDIL